MAQKVVSIPVWTENAICEREVSLEHLNCWPREFLTSRLTIVFELQDGKWSADAEAKYERMLPSEIASGSAQQDTKYDRDKDVTRDCGGVNQGEAPVCPKCRYLSGRLRPSRVAGRGFVSQENEDLG